MSFVIAQPAAASEAGTAPVTPATKIDYIEQPVLSAPPHRYSSVTTGRIIGRSLAFWKM
jgi:hypothetical protein